MEVVERQGSRGRPSKQTQKTMFYDVNLRDDRTIPNIVKVVCDVVDHRHPELPELLAGGHPQGLPLGQTWKVFTHSEEIPFWDTKCGTLLSVTLAGPPSSTVESATVVRGNQ